MAKLVKIKEIPELQLEQPNLLHVQESYLRQVANGKPFTAKRKSKSDVTGTGAKWYRQKGTGRSRQGTRKNPHLTGGGLAFPPTPRHATKKLNKLVRISALRSAVLAHLQNGSVYSIQGADFDKLSKTKEVAEILNGVDAPGAICLVIRKDAPVWRSSVNLPMVQLVTPERLNVRNLVESESLVFAQSAFKAYSELLKLQNEPPVPGFDDEEPEGGEQ